MRHNSTPTSAYLPHQSCLSGEKPQPSPPMCTGEKIRLSYHTHRCVKFMLLQILCVRFLPRHIDMQQVQVGGHMRAKWAFQNVI